MARIALAGALLALLSGCGGGGGEIPGPPPGPPILTILTTSLPDGITNVAYSQTLQATGGTGTRTWSLASGSGPLPTGLALSSAGVISGTPTTPGTFNFTAQVVDSGVPQQTATRALSIRIGDPLTITTTTLPNGTDGIAYNQTVLATGGIGTLTFSISAGSLPPGLLLNTSTGAITGAPNTGGTFNFTVRVVDSSNPQQSDTQAFTVLILQITTTGIPTGSVGTPYSTTLTAMGGFGILTWGTSGLPPSGNLTMDSVTGTISGTPQAADVGTFNLTASVTDSDTPPRTDTQALTLVISPQLVITTTSPLPSGTDGVAYTQNINASGGLGNRTWTILAGSLPPGLGLTSTAANAIVSGTPTSPGTFNFTVQVQDSGTPQQTDSRAFDITINPAPLVITTTTLQTGAIGAAYNATIQATGGTLPFVWSEPTASFDAGGVGTAATPCEGLTLNVAATGTSTAISGTPVNQGTCGPFTIRVDDSGAPAQFDTQDLSITVNLAPLGRNDCLPPGIGGRCIGPTALATGGNLTITASISPYADPPAGPANPDTDYYELTATGGTTVTIETFAQRAPINGGMDSVIEIVNASSTRFTSCRDAGPVSGVDGSPDPTPTAFDDVCLNDDITLGVLLDSKLEFQVPGPPGTVTFYVHVLDWRGDARPDLRYQMTITGAN